MIIEPRTYLGRELTASLRPWLDLSSHVDRNWPELIEFVMEQSGTQAGAADMVHILLHPDRLKRALEDKLLSHGIELIYASLPVAIVGYDQEIGLEGIVIANKTGSQFIRCSKLIDTTETAIFSRLCGETVVDFASDEKAAGTRQIRLAQALAMLGSQAAVPLLIERIMEQLQGAELPRRTADMMYVQLPPDHGAMPDVVYLLYSLAQTKDSRSIAVWQRVVDLMQPREEDFTDTWLGLYYYVDAISQGAERLGDRGAIPVLEQLHRIPYLNSQMSTSTPQSDYFLERRAMLELVIARALARCGSRLGYEVLVQYVSDGRSLLAKQALQQLQTLSGQLLDKDAERLRIWLDTEQPYRRTHPLQLQLDIETNSESILRTCEEKKI
ncbi:MAG: FAD-dependent oxidoreductase [Paenibacillus sp.]|nr:FAD-dependent oxidoreductase [Paenibacillus sp.]